MLSLDEYWVWDFWFAEGAEGFHIFFLKAPRALGDPELRHRNARIGHAVSDDLITWTELPDALAPSVGPAFDDLATWTGSIVRDDDGVWRMFFSGINRRGDLRVQGIGSARSRDLIVWERDPLVLNADPRWYETASASAEGEEAWRDPWVFRDPDAGGWRMLITARTPAGQGDAGDAHRRGVVASAVSDDLEVWRVQPPLSEPGTRFGHLEVLQSCEVDGHPVLLFSCLWDNLAGSPPRGTGGVWVVDAPGPAGPFPIAEAYRLTDESLYVGKLVRVRDGSWALMAFRNTDPDGAFIGGIVDPIPVLFEDGRLRIADRSHPAFPGEFVQS